MLPVSRLAVSSLLATMAFAAIPLHAASAQTEEPAAERRVISVVGEGEVRAKPDMAVIQLGVVAEAADAADALQENSASMTRITEALKEEGIEARDLQTSNFSVEPRYSQPPQDPERQEEWSPEIVGYTVRNTLSVRVRDLDSLGSVLNEVVGLGANSISGPSFTVSESGELENSARVDAIRDARERAETFAEAAGVSVGTILRIEETGYGHPEPMPMARAMKAESFDASVPIEGGELTFTAHVRTVWEIAE